MKYFFNDRGPEPLNRPSRMSLHKKISFVKSGIRILGYGLMLFEIHIAVAVLILSEGIGIIEELGEK